MPDRIDTFSSRTLALDAARAALGPRLGVRAPSVEEAAAGVDDCTLCRDGMCAPVVEEYEDTNIMVHGHVS